MSNERPGSRVIRKTRMLITAVAVIAVVALGFGVFGIVKGCDEDRPTTGEEARDYGEEESEERPQLQAEAIEKMVFERGRDI